MSKSATVCPCGFGPCGSKDEWVSRWVELGDRQDGRTDGPCRAGPGHPGRSTPRCRGGGARPCRRSATCLDGWVSWLVGWLVGWLGWWGRCCCCCFHWHEAPHIHAPQQPRLVRGGRHRGRGLLRAQQGVEARRGDGRRRRRRHGWWCSDSIDDLCVRWQQQTQGNGPLFEWIRACSCCL